MENIENFKIKGIIITKKEKEFLISKNYSYCSSCKCVKNISLFNKDINNNYGISSKCSECEKNRATERRLDFPEEVKLSRRKHKEKKREYYNNQKKQWDSLNRDRINFYKRNKYNSDPEYKMQLVCRLMVRRMFKSTGIKKCYKTSEVLGYTALELKLHIEQQFKEGMSWDNYGKWHIDHIIPLSQAKSLKEGIDLSQLSNLQPLWAKDNLIKSNKF